MLNSFLSWLTRGWRARQLAQRIIQQIHVLTDQPAAVQKIGRQSMLSILEETSSFLVSLQEQKDRLSISEPSVLPATSSDNNQPEESMSSVSKSQTPPTSQSAIPFSIPAERRQLEESANSEQESLAALMVPPVIAADDDRLTEALMNSLELASEESVLPQTTASHDQQAVSAIVRNLMKLSDWVLQAKVGRVPVGPEVLDEIYQRLTRTLATVGVSVLDTDTLPEQKSQTALEVATSATVRNLMKLSDWIVQVRAGRTSIKPEVLDTIYRQLTRALTLEGVSLVDAKGPCNYDRQMVMGTQATDNPALDDHVYSTVRPGYLFHGQLIRPQEVIVFVSENA